MSLALLLGQPLVNPFPCTMILGILCAVLSRPSYPASSGIHPRLVLPCLLTDVVTSRPQLQGMDPGQPSGPREPRAWASSRP